MILDIAQIAPPELDQKMQRKSSAAKVSIWLCGELALNCDASNLMGKSSVKPVWNRSGFILLCRT